MASQALGAPRVRGEQTNMAAAAAAMRAVAEPLEVEMRGDCLRLQIFDTILPGFGIEPVRHDGLTLLRPGEVAVYEEGWAKYNEPVEGFYCIERQTPLAPQPDSRRQIEREIAFVRRCARRPDSWETISLYSKVIHDQRRYANPQGPYYDWALRQMILGPIVGLYRPAPTVRDLKRVPQSIATGAVA
ncbi:hypothetical protein PQ455_07310 [Sphingomonas naphthae]|uniref:Uncharacterized protein n=1 Tax=Sphingomonas naphthae TaxID=1813468 RepID=A0ABY7TP53_9SPHN|nr:hypothetical protein [Sphingomonas naphthae]WCT75016.1 hypothetical protein PQ455_07310 [Sphingomonas naphthae]